MGRKKKPPTTAKPRPGASQPAIARWPPPALIKYLSQLQAGYRPASVGAPRSMKDLAEEARRNAFNPDHIPLLLAGLRGPWAQSDLPLWNLPFAWNQYDQIASSVRDREAHRARLVKRNRLFQSAMNWMKKLPFWSEEDRRQALRILARQKARLDDYEFHPMTSAGITRHPSKGVASQGFWSPFIAQLEDYLARTTQESEGCLFQMTARILHLASEGRFPDAPARVKQRWYRAMGCTKSAKEEPTEWAAGGQLWRKGQLVRLPEAVQTRDGKTAPVTAPVLGIAPEPLLRGFVLFLAAALTRDADLIQAAVSIFTQATLLIRVALSGPIGHPGSVGLYPPERLEPVT